METDFVKERLTQHLDTISVKRVMEKSTIYIPENNNLKWKLIEYGNEKSLMC